MACSLTDDAAEPAEDINQLTQLRPLFLGVAIRDSARYAGLEMRAKNALSGLGECSLHRGKLVEHLDAILLGVDHPRDSSDLPLDPSKSCDHLLLLIPYQHLARPRFGDHSTTTALSSTLLSFVVRKSSNRTCAV